MLLTLFSIQIAFAQPTQPAMFAKLESWDGSANCVALQPSRALEQGMSLSSGDTVTTSEDCTAVVEYVEGTTKTLGENTSVTLAEEEGVPAGKLSYGTVQVQVIKGISSHGMRFVFHTKSAVLGVRGTEFVVESTRDSDEAEFHTLDGDVELAPSVRELREGRGLKLGRENAVKFRQGRFELPRRFERAELIRRMQMRHPRMFNRMQGNRRGHGVGSVRPARHSLEQRREQLRKRGEHGVHRRQR